MENIVVLSAKLHQVDKMKEYHKKLLSLIDKVTRNDVSDAINNILDAISRNLEEKMQDMEEIYRLTLDALRDQNKQLWFTINLRLGKIMLE